MLDTSSAPDALNSIASKEHRLHRISAAFRKHIDARDNPVAEAVAWILGYRLIGADDRSERDRARTVALRCTSWAWLAGKGRPDLRKAD